MPNTLEENVNRVKAAKTAIANAITAKGGTVSSGDGLEDFASDIASIPSGGGGSQPQKDINFYDYDGTIVNSYTAAEFAELSSRPTPSLRRSISVRASVVMKSVGPDVPLRYFLLRIAASIKSSAFLAAEALAL